jgi:hypothetical protein
LKEAQSYHHHEQLAALLPAPLITMTIICHD